jgi:hypothetical protein
VADAALYNLGIGKPKATEGIGLGTFTVATFADHNAGAPATDFTAVVNWGDGSTSTVTGAGIVSLGGGKFAVLSSHTYAEEGTYTVAVRVSDVAGASVSGSLGLAVADAPLTSLALKNPNARAGQDTGTYTVATFHDRNVFAPATDFTAVVQWGDGTSTTVTSSGVASLGGGNFALLSDHVYNVSGTYTISLTVSDVGGASVTGRLRVSVT